MLKSRMFNTNHKTVYVIAIMLIGMLILALAGALYFIKGNNIFQKNNIDNNIFYEQMIEDIFPNNSRIDQVIKNEISIEVNTISNDILEITVGAPNICEDLIEWIKCRDENIEEDQLEKEIFTLLQQSSKEISTYKLHYKDNGDLEIEYTEDYLNTISCGLYDFYNYAMEQVILDMLKEDENE